MITKEILDENYYVCCLCIAGTPYVNMRRDIILRDNGDGVIYIYVWNVNGVIQPTEQQMMDTITIEDINNIRNLLY